MTYSDLQNVRHQANAYRMGCTDAYLCRDRVTYGPGPFGYTRNNRQCCCTSHCTEADGVGIEVNDPNCPHDREEFRSSAPEISRIWCLSVAILLTAWVWFIQ